MTTKLTFLILSLLPIYMYGQDSLFISSKSLENKAFYDTTTNFCHSSNYDIQTQSFFTVEKWANTYDLAGNCTRSEIYDKLNTPVYSNDYSYDSNNNLLETKSYSWDSTSNIWNPIAYRISTNSYNSNNLVLESQTEIYNPQNLTYYTTNKYINTYGANDSLKTHTRFAYSQSNSSLYISYTNTYNYNTNNNIIAKIDSNYLQWNSQWEVDSTLYHYDTFGRLISEESSISERNKTAYNYDTNDNNIQIIKFLWDTISNSWIYNNNIYYPTRYDKSFDSNNNLIEAFSYKYDNFLGGFTPYSEGNYVYDFNNNMIESNYSLFNDTLNIMQPRSKSTSSLDSNNQLTQRLDFWWDNNTNLWVNRNLYNFAFDSYGNEIYHDNLFWNASIGWIFCCKFEACEIPLSLQEKDEVKITIFPNPTRDYIYLKNLTIGSKIELYNITGKQLTSYKTINKTHSINLKELGGSGFYLLRVQSPNTSQVITKKIILE